MFDISTSYEEPFVVTTPDGWQPVSQLHPEVFSLVSGSGQGKVMISITTDLI